MNNILCKKEELARYLLILLPIATQSSSVNTSTLDIPVLKHLSRDKANALKRDYESTVNR